MRNRISSVKRFWRRTYAVVLIAAAPVTSMTALSSNIPIETRTVISEDGVRVVYDVRGTGDTALVFVHCWACNRHFWREQAQFFSLQYRVVTLDLAGHGDSGRDRSRWSILGLAKDVVAVADDLQLRRIVFVGHSMGGWVSLEAARTLRGRVVGVVLVDIMHDVGQHRTVAAAELDAAHLRKDFKGYFSDLSAIFSKDSDASIQHWVEREAMEADPMVTIALKLDSPNVNEHRLFERAGVPIRAINAQPPLSPRTNVEENKKYADYDVLFVSDAGHFMQLERPVEFNRDLETWLQYFSVATKN
jgi:pimeloyl-ACP methyl ester carboxylesterase